MQKEFPTWLYYLLNLSSADIYDNNKSYAYIMFSLILLCAFITSDTDECALRKQDPMYEDMYPCRKGVCQNTPGSYLCKCKGGKKLDDTNFECRSLHSSADKVVIGKLDSK
jgi:hypothetical protein